MLRISDEAAWKIGVAFRALRITALKFASRSSLRGELREAKSGEPSEWRAEIGRRDLYALNCKTLVDLARRAFEKPEIRGVLGQALLAVIYLKSMRHNA